jgi:hypothetical protein
MLHLVPCQRLHGWSPRRKGWGLRYVQDLPMRADSTNFAETKTHTKEEDTANNVTGGWSSA